MADLYESLIEYVSFLRHDFENYEKKAIEIFGSNIYKKDVSRTRRSKAFFDEGNAEDARETRSGSSSLNIEFFNEIISALITQLEKRLVDYQKLNTLFGFLTKIHQI